MKTNRSGILGPDGKPIVLADLGREKAAPEKYGARAILHYQEATGLTPTRLAEVMRQAALGHPRAYLTLAIDMEERYLHYASQLQTRRLALDGVSLSVSAPPGVDAKAVDFVESLVSDPGFPELVQSLQDAVGKGYAVVEPIWDYQDGALRPVDYRERDQRFFRFDETTQQELCFLLDSGLPGAPLRAPYFITHQPRLRAGVPVRRGVARAAAWAYVMQSFALQDWAAFCEIYGVPFRLGKYHSGATEQDKMTLLRAVRSIANDAAAIVPEGMTIEFQETNGARGEAVFGNFISYLDQKISLIILGQTMTSEVSKHGGSLAQAQVQENVRMDIVRADARQTAARLNEDLIRPAVAMNFGPQKVYPTLMMELSENEDLNALGAFLDKTIPLGLQVSQKFVRKRASIPEPEPDEDLLGAPAPPRDATQNASNDAPSNDLTPKDAPKDAPPDSARKARLALGGCPSCGETARFAADDPTSTPTSTPTAPDETDEIVDAALADEGFREIRDPLLAGLLAAVGESTGFDDLLARLDTAKIDSAALVERLTLATAKARGLGRMRD